MKNIVGYVSADINVNLSDSDVSMSLCKQKLTADVWNNIGYFRSTYLHYYDFSDLFLRAKFRSRFLIFFLCFYIINCIFADTVTLSDKFALWQNNNKKVYLRGANIWQTKSYGGVMSPFADHEHPVGPVCTQSDFDTLAATGANVVFLSHPGIYDETADSNGQWSVNENVKNNLDRLICMAARANLFVVIGFRTGPGRSEFTFDRDEKWFPESMLDESVWSDASKQAAWAEMWKKTAEYYKDNPVVIGYDIMVEPNSSAVLASQGKIEDEGEPEDFYPAYANTTYDWNQFYPAVIAAIREVDSNTPIIVSASYYGYITWLTYLKKSDDSRIVYAVHVYDPYVYTHQEGNLFREYPGYFSVYEGGEKESVNKSWLEDNAAPIDTFISENNVPVAVTEFGVMRWQPGADRYLKDSMNIYESKCMAQMLWAWYPASFPGPDDDGADDFNFRHGPDPNNNSEVQLDTPLITVIKNSWQKNTVRPSNVVFSEPSKVTFILNVIPTDTGTISPDPGAYSITPGEAVNITATPSLGYSFVRWTAMNSTTVFGNVSSSTTTVTLTSSDIITAVFTADTGNSSVNMTLICYPDSSGSLSPGEGTYSVNIGEKQTLSAISASGYSFVKWTAKKSSTLFSDPYAASTTVILYTDDTITAHFVYDSESRDNYISLGSLITVSSSILGKNAFFKKPKVRAIYISPINEHRKKVNLRVISRIDKNNNPSSLEIEFTKMLKLYNRRDYKGELLGSYLTEHPINNLKFTAVEFVFKRNFKVVLPYDYTFACPRISSVTGNYSQFGDEFTVIGYYFGRKLPKLFVEYLKNGNTGSPKYKKCKIHKSESLVFQNASGESNKSCMKILSDDPSAPNESPGYSMLKAVYPKFKESDKPTGYILLDNGAGIAVYKLP